MSCSRRKYRLAIHNALLIRPLHRPITADVLVAHNGTVAFIGKVQESELLTADRLIEAADLWLIPGFVSAYSQLWQHGFPGRAPKSNVKEYSQALYNETKDLSAEELFELTVEGAASHIRKGITTVFNFTYSSRLQDGRADRAQFDGAMHSGIRLVQLSTSKGCTQKMQLPRRPKPADSVSPLHFGPAIRQRPSRTPEGSHPSLTIR